VTGGEITRDINIFSPSVFAYGESTSLVRGRFWRLLFVR